MTAPRDDALHEWLVKNAPDCGDNSCLFGGQGKGGMRTNGGCRCYKDVRPDMRRIYIERMQAALRASPPTTKAGGEAVELLLESRAFMEAMTDRFTSYAEFRFITVKIDAFLASLPAPPHDEQTNKGDRT